MSEQSPNHLPIRPSFFVDRRKDIEDFRAAAQDARDDARPLLYAVLGPEGIGKTTFAVRACYEVIDYYPDLRLYVDVRGSELDTPMPPEAIAAALLRQAGVADDQIPAEPSECIGAARARLAGKRVLVLLDDVAEAGQLDQLLFTSASAVVVVTSRRPLSGLRRKGFHAARLQPFADDDASELVGRLIGGSLEDLDTEVLRKVRAVCEGLPLALSIAAVRLSEPGESAADYLAELLRGEPYEALELDGERPVLRVFEATYHELDESEARAYSLLAMLPGPDFGAGVAAAVLDVPEIEAVPVLRGLTRRFVLTSDGDRYRFHGLVRSHARETARAAFSPTTIAAAVRCAVRWYGHRLVALDRVVSERPFPVGARHHYESVDVAATGSDAKRTAWAELAVEWPNLVAAMRQPDEMSDDDMVTLFPLALWSFGYQTRRCVELVDAYKRALDRAQDTGTRWQLYRDIAGLHERLGEPDNADDYLESAISTEYGPGVASVHEWRGLNSEGRADPKSAVDHLLRSWEAVPLVPDPAQQRRSYALLNMHLGRARYQQHDFEQAVVTLLAARDYFDTHSEPVNSARSSKDLGRAYARLGQRSEAVTALESAFADLREHGVNDNARQAAEELAELAELDGRPDEAREWRDAADSLPDA